jgi:uncharacterized tellurite resistance protein B-like protein
LLIAGLSDTEINAIIEKLQQADPEAFAGKNVTELRQELATNQRNYLRCGFQGHAGRNF